MTITDVDGVEDAIGFRSLELSVQKRVFKIEMDERIDVSKKTGEVLDGLRRYMFFSTSTWDQLVREFDPYLEGYIRLDDFRNGILELGIMKTDAGLNLVYDEYDRNKDGRMSTDEFYTAFKERYNMKRAKQQDAPSVYDFFEFLRDLCRR